MSGRADVAIVGAGPYGLSIAAHLRAGGVSFRIFGRPMQTWLHHMPNGMLLKSDGFGSNLSDPQGAFTLKHYCQTQAIDYDDTRIPVSLDTFRAYTLAFQQRFVPDVENTDVVGIERDDEGFRLSLADGRTATARKVVLAIGITHFANMPSSLIGLPAEFASHSSAHEDVSRFRGHDVTVIGAGASALDLAVILKDAQANVTVVARRPKLKFQDPPGPEGRSLWRRIRRPDSMIGPGWQSRFYTDGPGLFYYLPEAKRLSVVRTYLGPAAGWPTKARFVGRIPSLLGYEIKRADVRQGRVWLELEGTSGRTEHTTEHVIAATGYKVDLERLTFLSEAILSRIRAVDRAPVLSPEFESSVRGLYFVGIASANNFGPMMRFACGAAWTAGRISPVLVKSASRRTAPAVAEAVAR